MNSYEQSILTAKAISSKKGLNIKLIEIGDISSLADYMVIATGTSSTHVKAIADEVEYQLDEAYRSNSWILLDYVDVIVHIFSDEAREFYDLERLWQDGKEIDISDIVD